MPTTPQGNVLTDLFVNVPGYLFPFLGGPGARARQAEKAQHQVSMQDLQLREQAIQHFLANPQQGPYIQPSRQVEGEIARTGAMTTGIKSETRARDQETNQRKWLFPGALAQQWGNVGATAASTAATRGAERRAGELHGPQLEAANSQQENFFKGLLASVLPMVSPNSAQEIAIYEKLGLPTGPAPQAGGPPAGGNPAALAATAPGVRAEERGALDDAVDNWPYNLQVAPGGVPMNLPAIAAKLGELSTQFPNFFARGVPTPSMPQPRGEARPEANAAAVQEWLQQGQQQGQVPIEQFQQGGQVRGPAPTAQDVMQWMQQGQQPPLVAGGTPVPVPQAVMRPIVRSVGGAAEQGARTVQQAVGNVGRVAEGATRAVPLVARGARSGAAEMVRGLPARAARRAAGIPTTIGMAQENIPGWALEILHKQHPDASLDELREMLRQLQAGEETK